MPGGTVADPDKVGFNKDWDHCPPFSAAMRESMRQRSGVGISRVRSMHAIYPIGSLLTMENVLWFKW